MRDPARIDVMLAKLGGDLMPTNCACGGFCTPGEAGRQHRLNHCARCGAKFPAPVADELEWDLPTCAKCANEMRAESTARTTPHRAEGEE